MVNVTSSENKTIKNSTISVYVAPVVNLTVVKVADMDDAAIGDVITFTITVTNNGPSNATNIRVIDVLDDGLTLISGDLESVIPFLASGNSTTVVVKVRTTAKGDYMNCVNVSCDENGTVKSANASVHVFETDMKINKTANVTSVDVNGLVNFTIVVKNHGKSNATNIHVTDELDGAFEFVDASAGYTRDGQTIVWNIPKLANETEYRLWIVVRALTNGTFDNIAHVNCSEEETVKNSTSTVNVIPVVNLTVNKTVDVTEIRVGGEVTFTVNVTNNGPSNATGVKISDVVPSGFEFVRASDSGYDNATGLLTIGLIKPGESYVFTITLKAITNGTLTNVVNVTSSENKTIKNSTISVYVAPVVNLTVVKVADMDDAAIGDVITFTITVTNNGPSNATNIRVIDVLDDGLTLISGDLESVIPFLASGNSTTVVVKVRTTAKGDYMNCVNVSCDENGTVKSANASVHVFETDMKINKTANVTSVDVNGLVNFTIVVKNHGKSNATNIHVTDELDGAFEFVDASAGYTRDGQTIVWNIPKLANETEYRLWIVVRALTNGTFDNIAHVNCSEEETVKNSTSTVNVTPVVNLTVNKTVEVAEVSVGGDITFTVNVTNNGPSDATGVKVTDVVPEGFEFVSSSTGDYDSETGLLTVPVIKAGESYVFAITLKAMTNGTLTNVVNVTCAENDTVVSTSVDVDAVYDVNLTVVKVADTDDAAVGDEITFTIIVTNNGVSNATNIKVKDILDEEGFELISGDLESVIPFLASGDSANVVVKVRTIAKGTYMNTVNVSCTENDTVVSANATVNVYTTDLKINKTANVTSVDVGGLVNFTIVVKNHGNSKATNLHISEVLDDAFKFVDASGNYSVDGQNIVWTIDSLDGEATSAVWVVVKVLSNGTFENVAHVNCSEEDTPKNSTTTVNVLGSSMNITVKANDEFVYSGNQTSFTITVTNTGETVLKGITIKDNIPEGLIYDHFTGSNWTYDGKFHYNGSLAVGESVELIVVVNATKSGDFLFEATASADYTDDVSDSDNVLVYTPALTVREISNNPRAVVGQTVSFTVVVTNTGDCDLSGVYTVNNFPEGLIYTGYDGDSWNKLASGLLGAEMPSWTQDGDKFIYSGILRVGESANYTLYFQTTRTGVFTPEVVANSDLTSGAYSNNTTVVVAPELEVKQDIDKSKVEVGEKVKITVTVTNTGGCDLGDVYVIENVPEGLKYNSFTGDGWTKVGDKFIYNGVLGIGESASFTMEFTAVKEGNVNNGISAGSNMTEEVDDDVDVEIVNKTKPAPGPEPTPGPTPDPTPSPENETVEKTDEFNKPVVMRETGNPIILLLLVILALIPLKRRKH